MPFYTDVTNGDTITAAKQNALYDDISDLTAGHNHNGVTARVAGRNITFLSLTDNFETNSISYVVRTGGIVSIDVKSTGRVWFYITSCWTINLPASPVGDMFMRINRDSGTEYVYMGRSRYRYRTYPTTIEYTKDYYFTGLSLGNHTFQSEVRVYASVQKLINNGSSDDINFRMFAMEV